MEKERTEKLLEYIKERDKLSNGYFKNREELERLKVDGIG